MTSSHTRTESRFAPYLCDATRFKLSFNRSGYTGALANFKNALDGEWVALVPASNDAHMRLTRELAALRRVARLASELCNAADAEHMDIGGHRPVAEIFKELGPACDVTDAFSDEEKSL